MKKLYGSITGGAGLFILMMIVFAAATARAIGWEIGGDAAPPLMFFGMAVMSQGNTIQDIVKWEQDNLHSREVVTVLAGQDLALGTVLGKITKSTPTTGTAGAGNTGSGTCTAVTAGTKTKIGTYILTALSATAFIVQDPDGFSLPDAVVGTPYVNDNINFTINDGSPDFISGDSFMIEVAAGSGSVRQINFDGVDGSQVAYGILYAAVDATDGALPGVAYVRDADIVPDDLVWPATSPEPTDAQIAGALSELAAKGIVTRTEA